MVEAIGMKGGKRVMVEAHVMAPGMVQSFEMAELTAEMYLTGRDGAIFTKMILEERINRAGLMSTAMLEYDQVDYYIDCVKELDILFETEIKEIP